MRYYETMYIVNPGFEKERLNKIIETINDEFEKNKVNVINHYVWGKKHLAYSIQKHKYGNYLLIHFENDKQHFLLDLEMFLKLNTSVMRHQTVRLDKKPKVVELEDIIIENEMIETGGNDGEIGTEETFIPDPVDTKIVEDTDEDAQESEVSPVETQQAETEDENVEKVSQEEIED
ncbi:MAG: 30S ribosomal protein S6 [Candidatus Marinimicrobia bacterium]|nr:30S ribosomal protein S6 [Candidatus Neomarinimicrobiota bacterium]|tara:strand:- start:1973 stop:2500 length:528 start_codon:yes stop_codon:yes gene_type:complete